jgi:DNA mismatch repair protein MutS
VRDGPANRSYGLQVARLAGLPPPVVRAAGQLLEALEARAREDDAQIDLFAGPSGESPGDAAHGAAIGVDHPADPDRARAADEAIEDVLQRLRAADPDQMTARAALDLLYELHGRLAT